MSGGLTKRQSRCIGFIRRYADQHDGVSPSYEEIGAALGLRSKSGVHRIIMALKERGFIETLPNRARAIHLHTWPAVQAGASAETLLGTRLHTLVETMAAADGCTVTEIIRDAVEAYWDGWGLRSPLRSTAKESADVEFRT